MERPPLGTHDMRSQADIVDIFVDSSTAISFSINVTREIDLLAKMGLSDLKVLI